MESKRPPPVAAGAAAAFAGWPDAPKLKDVLKPKFPVVAGCCVVAAPPNENGDDCAAAGFAFPAAGVEVNEKENGLFEPNILSILVQV